MNESVRELRREIREGVAASERSKRSKQGELHVDDAVGVADVV